MSRRLFISGISIVDFKGGLCYHNHIRCACPVAAISELRLILKGHFARFFHYYFINHIRRTLYVTKRKIKYSGNCEIVRGSGGAQKSNGYNPVHIFK